MANEHNPLARRLPHGLSDLFFEEAAAKIEFERLLQETFERWGYQRVIVPTFEFDETLSTGASPDLKDEIYRFFDRDGRVLALRPDMTVPTARLVGTRLFDQTLPLRFCYIGNVFRYEEPQAGRRREFSQAGVELIGASTPEADAEVLALVVACLRAVKMTDFQINLGQVAFLKAILADTSLANGDSRRLERAIGRKNDAELQRTLDELHIAGDAARAVRAIPHLSGDESILDEARRLSDNRAARQAIDHLARVYQLARCQGIATHIILDLSESRGMDYYTGITFHGYVAGLGFPVCSGGRYDDLVRHFGADLPAVGFALGIERSMLVTKPPVDLAPDLLIASCPHPACYALAERARALDLRVEMEVLGRQEEALLRFGQERRARHILRCLQEGSYLLIDARGARQIGYAALEEELATWKR
jgi:ATP phosphoribosyltransferase regulatory subunit